MSKVSHLREDYQKGKLDRSDLSEHPLDLFEHWITEAIENKVSEPNAMVLSTIDLDGNPNARTVLLKGYDKKGFVFYTNYESEKAIEIAKNPAASLVFTWLDMERQVRIKGQISKVSKAETAAYFYARPRGSQLGAWVSPQSQVLSSRHELEQALQAREKEFEGLEQLPLPPHWGGYRLSPNQIEFWQGRSSRLHDRWRYELQGSAWKANRLAP